jgi:SAM-dependent methyltransferase
MTDQNHDHMEANRAHWDELARIHPETAFYDVPGFKAGRSTLDEIELEGVGEVDGRTLLHLQCHFGMDTISWARRGAIATGADFSGEAISLARSLAEEIGVSARFVQSNVYDLPEALDEQFDIVFTSHGVLGWLPDIQGWARVVAHFLKPGGRFFIVEGHPFSWTLDDEDATGLTITYPYFQDAEPLTFEQDGSYADESATLTHRRTHEWNHPLGETITALIDAGLTIERVREYPFCSWRMVPLMERDADGWWKLPVGYPSLPFLFSIRALNDAS